jgi:LysM repeat protein
LASVAQKNGVSVSNLMSWNKLNDKTPLKAGQSIALLIPTTPGRQVAKAPPTAVRGKPKAVAQTAHAKAHPQSPSVKVAKK